MKDKKKKWIFCVSFERKDIGNIIPEYISRTALKQRPVQRISIDNDMYSPLFEELFLAGVARGKASNPGEAGRKGDVGDGSCWGGQGSRDVPPAVM